ncbi:MAG: Type 1 glutamine amidotransferase-like domain-containing protein [Planctomycetes bacterium]|nr:Type 1 glutamine amidotransferase-like domain-containing protein [Planctomycetota bacterium]
MFKRSSPVSLSPRSCAWLLSGHDPFMGGTKEIDRQMFKEARGKNILFLPASHVLDGQVTYCERFAEYAAGFGLSCRSVLLPEINPYTEEPTNPGDFVRSYPTSERLDRAGLRRLFEWADYLYFGGGRPEQFIVNFTRFDLHDLVRDAFTAGKVMIGYSAGAYYFSELWWEPNAVTLLLPYGSVPTDDEIARCALLGFRYVNLADLMERNHFVNWTILRQFGRNFQFEGLSEWGFFKVYFTAYRGMGLLPKLFCRVHFEALNFQDQNEFFLMKANFGGHCVVKLENPEAYRVRAGGVENPDGSPALSEFTGQPVRLDQFEGLPWMLDRVNDVPGEYLNTILSPARGAWRSGKAPYHYFTIIPPGGRRTHQVVTDADGALLPGEQARKIVVTLLAQGRLELLYPPDFPALGG